MKLREFQCGLLGDYKLDLRRSEAFIEHDQYSFGSQPFTWNCLDHMGAVIVKAMYNRRVQMKVCPVIFVCQATGAIHMEVYHDYSMGAFLLQWSHFTSHWGMSEEVVSDQGS